MTAGIAKRGTRFPHMSGLLVELASGVGDSLFRAAVGALVELPSGSTISHWNSLILQTIIRKSNENFGENKRKIQIFHCQNAIFISERIAETQNFLSALPGREPTPAAARRWTAARPTHPNPPPLGNSGVFATPLGDSSERPSPPPPPLGTNN